eukprot:CAMPEP_0115007786 /NCGR_PEP_ID=MMETSP0216-20121206/21447_1 /TAXON_ID=223996 /ORGANISM="Protocruzia adherens, Strain Boccale" /LENGTH=294 /DNA_ID=CAMNT_0002374915 /DNA_START=67 /DNA_END=951 /DNA_ORIENTATION=-
MTSNELNNFVIDKNEVIREHSSLEISDVEILGDLTGDSQDIDTRPQGDGVGGSFLNGNHLVNVTDKVSHGSDHDSQPSEHHLSEDSQEGATAEKLFRKQVAKYKSIKSIAIFRPAYASFDQCAPEGLLYISIALELLFLIIFLIYTQTGVIKDDSESKSDKDVDADDSDKDGDDNSRSVDNTLDALRTFIILTELLGYVSHRFATRRVGCIRFVAFCVACNSVANLILEIVVLTIFEANVGIIAATCVGEFVVGYIKVAAIMRISVRKVKAYLRDQFGLFWKTGNDSTILSIDG